MTFISRSGNSGATRLIKVIDSPSRGKYDPLYLKAKKSAISISLFGFPFVCFRLSEILPLHFACDKYSQIVVHLKGKTS